ncbi:MAG: sigma-70 family RNA polymerase sigma factor [Oscillospiraceae bacterium]|nr:sigma-70 family RNA polymerase sigma factor [Oscillospiraceae bacterium]
MMVFEENLGVYFDTYYDRLYSFCLFRVKNIHDAQDITSEVFFRAVKSSGGFDESRASVSTWLFKIAVNEIKRHHTKKRHTLPLEQAKNLPSADNIIDSVLIGERAKELYDAMDQLDERHKNVLLLKYYGQLNNKEIARILKITETNAETILYRAKKKLKKLLEKREVFENEGYKIAEAEAEEAGYV